MRSCQFFCNTGDTSALAGAGRKPAGANGINCAAPIARTEYGAAKRI
jgi:hypothetical protein